MTNKILERIISSDCAIGALWGAAIGDALGWPQERLERRLDQDAPKEIGPQIEFQHWAKRSGRPFHAYEEVIRPGEYSDETQLLIATARSLLRGSDWSLSLAFQELPIWLLYQRGAGKAVTQAAKSWQNKKSPWHNTARVIKRYFATEANGAAMRVLPHALLPNLSVTEMHTQVMQNGALTHGHPRALLGAMLYAQAARFMVDKSDTLAFGELVQYLRDTHQEWSKIADWGRGYNHWLSVAQKYSAGKYNLLWQNTVEELMDGLQLCASEIKVGVLSSSHDFLTKIGGLDKSTNGAGTVAALAAVYFSSLYAADPVTGLSEAAFAEGADTDTIASMVGGLLGALLGTEWIVSGWREVQDKEYLSRLAVQLIQADVHQNGEENKNDGTPPRWRAKDSSKLQNELKKIYKNQTVDLGALGQAQAVRRLQYRSLVRRWQHLGWELKTNHGQTILITKISQIKSSTKVVESPKTPAIAIATLLHDISSIMPAKISPNVALELVADVVLFLENDRQQMGEEPFLTALGTEDYIQRVVNKIQEKHQIVAPHKELIGKIAKNLFYA